ncbi:MAG: DUF6106 family protein [Oscillospiraceae bacterium]|jgi:hypothetical protein|nr:DUF6106 family protein [Oscillospiraceae bacterium]
MADVFVEHMVIRRPTLKIFMQKCLLSFSAVIVALLPLILEAFTGIPLGMIMPFTIVGAGWGMLILFRRLNLEFEYIVTNGEMDVDKIMGRNSRKRIMTVDCRNFDILAPYKTDYRGEYESQAITTVVDVSSHTEAPGRWFAIFHAKDGKRTLLIFEPSERMLEAFRMYIRNKIKS